MSDVDTMSLDDLRIAVAREVMGYGEIYAQHIIIPDYPRDIAAAWLVVEKLKYVSIYAPKAAIVQEYENEFDDEWGCEIKPYKDAPVWESVDGRGATAPEAICRAALKAVRADKA